LIGRLQAETAKAERAERDRRLGLGEVEKPAEDGISPWWYVGGGVTVVAIAVGAVVLLSGSEGAAIPESDLGNLDFGQ